VLWTIDLRATGRTHAPTQPDMKLPPNHNQPKVTRFIRHKYIMLVDV
jgi:hypothetical protein